MLIHSGRKDFQSEVCQKMFARKYNLSNHILVHSKEKPHECKIYKKKFLHKSNLNVHKRIHTGDVIFVEEDLQLVLVGINICTFIKKSKLVNKFF